MKSSCKEDSECKRKTFSSSFCGDEISDSKCGTTPSPAESPSTECSKFVGEECTSNAECCHDAMCGTDSICYKECQYMGDNCKTDDDCCGTGKCSRGINGFCYKNLPANVEAPPLASKVIAGKRVRLQLLSLSPFELFELLIYDKSGTNIAEASTPGVSISSYQSEGQATNAISSNHEGCILKQIGSWIEVTLGSSADISAIEIYSKEMKDGFNEASRQVVISIGDELNSAPQKYASLYTAAGSTSQITYAAEFRDVCTSSTECFEHCEQDEDCKKACGWEMGGGIFDPSLWCAMGFPDKENITLKLCEDQVAAATNNEGIITVSEDRELLTTQCAQNEVPIEISSKFIVRNVYFGFNCFAHIAIIYHLIASI